MTSFYALALIGLLMDGAMAVSVADKSASSSSLEEVSFEGDQVAAKAALTSMVSRMFEQDGKKPRLHEVMHSLAGHVNMKSAVHRLQQKHLPRDVMSLVSAAATQDHKAHGEFDEASLTKAREVLNDMVQSSQAELDTKIIDCETLKQANRGTMNQIVIDLARLAEQITDLERLKLEANNGITKTKEDIIEVKEQMNAAEQEYLRIKAIDDADMRVKQNDLDVFQFILEFTKCTEAEMAGALMQTGHKHAHARICQAHDHLVIDFSNKELNQKYERMMTPTARKEIAKVLAEVQAVPAKPVSLLQVSEDPNEVATTTFAPIMSATVPVLEGSGESGEYKCPPTPPDCGLLHDKMSLMWGVYKDQVDELQEDMDRKDKEWEELRESFQSQIEILTNTLNTFSAQLAEATASLAGDRVEQAEKEQEKRVVEAEYEDFMGKCKVRIEWILFQDICAIVVVRNAVLTDSTVCPTAGIVDCDVEDWIPGTCTVSCDDSCPHPQDPFSCGGWQTLQRRVVIAPNSCGLACPELTYQKKCNQIKCPVDCVMSEWSEYSKCTRDCEGGVQQRSRSILTNAKNGGAYCENPTEEQECNTGSCDRDCTLADWTAWTPCSMACTPEGSESGFTKRQKDVVVPTRGMGKCPVQDSPDRMEYDECNAHACHGDEECYALQDLVLAIDGSGSITADNFEILKEYVMKLLKRYKGEVENQDLMKVGIVQFGNGEIADDGTISAALKLSPLTADMASLESIVSGMSFLKGFTNMAQAFAIAETMYTEAGRQDALSAVLTITDGRPSFQYQTNNKVMELEEKGIQRYFITIAEEEGDETDLMKKWASDPWYTNHIHIPGFLALASTNETYVQEAVVMFCPNSQAPEVCHATAYQHAGFLGWAADYPEGAYNMNQMMARGAPNDDMSSLKVWGTGCMASLYQHWDFTGYEVDYPEGWYDFRSFLRQGARNDDISSIWVWKP